VSGGCPPVVRDLDDARQVIAATCFPPRSRPHRVGLEVELFPIELLADGTPRRRVPIHRLVTLLDQFTGALPSLLPRQEATPAYPLASGGTLTFEPGGQLEHSTAPHPSTGAALAEADQLAAALATALGEHGIALVSCGLDLWHPPARVPQQLRAPRYPALAAYLGRRGPHGATMMRCSAALQVNLDLGGGEPERRERWLVANLVAPLALATFAASPGRGAVSRRALAWQRLDPTRTGFPRRLVDGSSADPVEQFADAALRADVAMLRRPSPAPVDGAGPAPAGFAPLDLGYCTPPPVDSAVDRLVDTVDSVDGAPVDNAGTPPSKRARLTSGGPPKGAERAQAEPGGGWLPGWPGWTFGDWIRDGHPAHGPPTADDLRYHLSTLFFEVRPRGRLELRSLDALPARLRPVPVVLLAGLLEDPAARVGARAVLERWQPKLPELWRRAARRGVADPELCALAATVWSFALEGAQRQAAQGRCAAAQVATAEAFLDRLTLRGRCPADELRAALAQGPAAALAWAREPAAVAVPATEQRNEVARSCPMP
jgi:glutamate--cysteine ligase